VNAEQLRRVCIRVCEVVDRPTPPTTREAEALELAAATIAEAMLSARVTREEFLLAMSLT